MNLALVFGCWLAVSAVLLWAGSTADPDPASRN